MQGLQTWGHYNTAAPPHPGWTLCSRHKGLLCSVLSCGLQRLQAFICSVSLSWVLPFLQIWASTMAQPYPQVIFLSINISDSFLGPHWTVSSQRTGTLHSFSLNPYFSMAPCTEEVPSECFQGWVQHHWVLRALGRTSVLCCTVTETKKAESLGRAGVLGSLWYTAGTEALWH